MNTLPEWTDLRFFLELARAGTLSGASRRLDVEHTTVARRIDRLETQLGATLFDRSREGYELTEVGLALLPHAEAMEGAALAAAEQIGGAEVAAHGVVRLGVPEVFGVKVVAPLLVGLLDQHPDLQIDLLALPRFANLANREADLGVMLDPPTTGRYVVTRLASFHFYLYAAPGYLARHPAIRTQADLARHDFVDYVQDRLASRELSYLNELGFTPRRRMCCSGMTAQIEAASLGMGLMMAPPYAVPDDGRLVPVLPGFSAERSFWLAAPTDLYRLRRVKVVWDVLREYADSSPSLFVQGGMQPALAPD
ncbi:LysR family transcriptional regulator [Massilia timonae]|jgi:DNA-binding transcriptional LysR family regulator|uniref:Bacterial regulatory helix-turn-helix, lysR family protein n=1 Tax=Massilia timonae TaxID=47229 RepID=A0A1S2N569_9BURK|nr:LysR family transcriptional regulator [Massilia timonae]OIJ40227.1 bacterial regulatory helix-turn-helix, lysR family protein [Massilia timonae]